MKSKKFLISLFTLLVIVICIAIFIFDNINGKFFLNDFKVYYLAAKALMAGEKVYGVSFGLSSGVFKYSPFILLFFIPLAFLPYNVAAIIFYLIIVCAIIILFNQLRYIMNKYVFGTVPKHENLIYLLAFVFTLNQVYRDLHMGNTNIILLMLLMASLIFILRAKPLYAGITAGIAILFKPFFLILALPLLIYGRWKTLLYGAAGIALQFLVFLLIFGTGHTFALCNEWISAMMAHSAFYVSANTITSIINNLSGINIPASLQYIIIAVTALLYVAFELIAQRRAKSRGEGKAIETRLVFGWMLLLAILPDIVNTDTEHFLYALPLIVFITYYLVSHKNWLLRVLFFLLFLLHSINSRDIVGRYLNDLMSDYGILGISNICLVGMGIYIMWREW